MRWRRESRQLTESQVFELNRRAFGFEAEIPGAGFGAVAAGDFFAVDPQADLAIDGANVVVIPLADAAAELLTGEAAFTTWGDRLERLQLGCADGEDIAV